MWIVLTRTSGESTSLLSATRGNGQCVVIRVIERGNGSEEGVFPFAAGMERGEKTIAAAT